MASFAYTTGLKEILDRTVDFVNDTIKVMLIANDTVYTPDKDHTYVDMAGANDPIDCELNCTGYQPGFAGTGRATLASKTITADLATDCIKIDAADPAAWTLAIGKTVVAAIVYKHLTSDAASRLLFFVDFTDTPTNGGSVTLQFHADGIHKVNT